MEALERARAAYGTGAYDDATIEFLFPEVKESEDEKIRKELIEHIKEQIDSFISSPDCRDVYEEEELAKYKRWIAYIEKQKTSEEAIKYVKESHSSDEVSDFQAAMNIAVAKAYDKGVQDTLEKQKEQKPSAPEDIAAAYQMGLAKGRNEQKPAEWSEENFPKDIEKDAIQFCFDKGINITPHQAKEIATHYLMVGHNEGYVEGRKNAHIPAKELGLPSSMDFKQEWGEEDKSILNNIVAYKYLNIDDLDWLKDLPNRFNLLPKQEWSEEDEILRVRTINRLETLNFHGIPSKEIRESIDWLKFLKFHWKPSEEQMEALKYAIDHEYFDLEGGPLYDLYNDLQKLL